MTSPKVSGYAADRVSLIWFGFQITGLGPDTFIEVEMATDDNSEKVGADGEVAVARSANKTASIKITLLQTSSSNTLLSQIRAAGEVSPNGLNTGVFDLRDLTSGARLAHANISWIKKPPTVKRGRETEEYEWSGMAADMVLTPLGSFAI